MILGSTREVDGGLEKNIKLFFCHANALAITRGGRVASDWTGEGCLYVSQREGKVLCFRVTKICDRDSAKTLTQHVISWRHRQ